MAQKSPNIANVVQSLGSGKKAPAMSILNEVGMSSAVLISKLRRPTAHAEVAKNDRETSNIVNYAEVKSISEFIGKKKKESEHIAKLFPDVELAKQIYVSSTIAPKDMVSTEILYEIDDPLFPPEVVTKASECIRNNVEGIHGLGDDLQDIIRISLFEEGSYPIATIPESSLDEVINSDRNMSLESASPLFADNKGTIKSLGFLGDPDGKDGLALESFFNGTTSRKSLKTNTLSSETIDLGIEIFDNHELLKLPRLHETMVENATKELLGVKSMYRRHAALEAARVTSDEEIKSSVFKGPTNDNRPIVTVNSKDNTVRRSVGRALRMKIPAEATIPVYTPGQPDRHVGYFIVLDSNGAPITIASERSNIDGFSNMMNTNTGNNQSTGLNSYLLKKAKDTLVGSDKVPTLMDMSRIYSSIVEKEIMSKLKNGLYNKNLEVSESSDIYRMMMFRALQGMQTRMLYVPASLITYYAFRYHDNGTGKSMMDDLTMLISTRATLMTARVLQQIRSSINSTNVQVSLDPKDQDPEKTMETTVANVMKYLQFQMPVGLITQADIYEWVSRAGVRFSFEGHEGLPELKYDFTNDTIGNTIPDTDLDEDLQRRTYMAFGLSPDQVDNSLSPDFATSIVASNVHLSKRVLNTQKVYVRLMSEDARKIMSYDMVAYGELRAIIKEGLPAIKKRIKDTDDIDEATPNEEELITELTDRYIKKMCLSLPKPDMTTIDNQVTAINKAEEIFDKIIEYHVSAEAFPEMVSGEANGKIEELKGIIKASLMRGWLADNPSFKEINDLIGRSIDKDGKTTIFDTTKMHYEGFVHSMLKFMKEAKPFANAASRDLSNITENESTGDEPAPSDVDSSSPEGSESSGDGEATTDAGSEDEDGFDVDTSDAPTPPTE